MAPSILIADISGNVSTEATTIATTSTKIATLLNTTSSTTPTTTIASNVTTILTTATPPMNTTSVVFLPPYIYIPTTNAPDNGYYYNYYWDYSFYILLVFIFFLFLPMIFIKIAIRKRKTMNRTVILQRQQARRQAEINATNSNGGDNSANSRDPNDISILPKDYDLPPAYDEVVINAKQQLQIANNNPSFVRSTSMTITGAVSTITIETDLESSNNNLAATAASVDNVPAAAMELNCVSTSSAAAVVAATHKSEKIAEHSV